MDGAEDSSSLSEVYLNNINIQIHAVCVYIYFKIYANVRTKCTIFTSVLIQKHKMI